MECGQARTATGGSRDLAGPAKGKEGGAPPTAPPRDGASTRRLPGGAAGV